jgi:hypothetical protein
VMRELAMVALHKRHRQLSFLSLRCERWRLR